jgi:dolichyl-phosphate-mannose-protein mannosyltransferase
VYGSLVTIRHLETSGGYLHSHSADYPEGSTQQQVTLYPFKDQNNWWRIIKADSEENYESNDILGNEWLQYVRHGDIVLLEHVRTEPHMLHSHDIPAPVTDTDYHFEVRYVIQISLFYTNADNI